MSNYVDSEHIHSLIQAGDVKCLPCNVSEEAELYLETTFPLRMAPTLVDWDRLPHMVLKWMEVSDRETEIWSLRTLSGQMPYGLLLYSPSQPCLIGTYEFMIRNLDILVWKAPGNRILFGVNQTHQGNVRFTKGIIEYNGVGTLFATTEIH